MELEPGVEEYLKSGSLTQASKETGIPRSTIYSRVKKLKVDKPLVAGSVEAPKHPSLWGTDQKTYFLTCAQNNTRVHKQLWANMLQYADMLEADILVSRFTYNHMGFYKPKDSNEMWYDPCVSQHVNDSHLELADGLHWCGETNTLPTARRPLSGYETHTGTDSAIYPHVKFALEPIATAKAEATKMTYTTGTVTERNYIAKKAGLVAEHHHCYGFLLVTVEVDGSWKARQVNATDDGNFQDMDLVFNNGTVTSGNRVEAITWGDIHACSLGGETQRWEDGGLLDQLMPRYQFMHDVFDGHTCNHYDDLKPLNKFKNAMYGTASVQEEILDTAEFLKLSEREWCTTVVPDANHNARIDKWLDTVDFRKDHINAVFFLEANLFRYSSKVDASGMGDMLTLEWATRRVFDLPNTTFLKNDDSYIVADIENGMHGHIGPNGSRGTPMGLSKVAHKANIGHSHAARIIDGLYVAGVCQLDHGYNEGPSSWSISHIITYPNGKRTIITE